MKGFVTAVTEGPHAGQLFTRPLTIKCPVNLQQSASPSQPTGLPTLRQLVVLSLKYPAVRRELGPASV